MMNHTEGNQIEKKNTGDVTTKGEQSHKKRERKKGDFCGAAPRIKRAPRTS